MYGSCLVIPVTITLMMYVREFKLFVINDVAYLHVICSNIVYGRAESAPQVARRSFMRRSYPLMRTD